MHQGEIRSDQYGHEKWLIVSRGTLDGKVWAVPLVGADARGGEGAEWAFDVSPDQVIGGPGLDRRHIVIMSVIATFAADDPALAQKHGALGHDLLGALAEQLAESVGA